MTPRKSKLTAVKGWAVKIRGRYIGALFSGEQRAINYARMFGGEAVHVEIRELFPIGNRKTKERNKRRGIPARELRIKRPPLGTDWTG